MQTLSKERYEESFKKLKEQDLSIPCLRRQTHMYCVICEEVSESYNQKKCYECGSTFKWSIPWKNETIN